MTVTATAGNDDYGPDQALQSLYCPKGSGAAETSAALALLDDVPHRLRRAALQLPLRRLERVLSYFHHGLLEMSRIAPRPRRITLLQLACLAVATACAVAGEQQKRVAMELKLLQEEVRTMRPDPALKDDPFILVAIQEALAGKLEGNGGIGACLVREATGEIIVRGHNRQYSPYFRSDMHAEMDLMNRYDSLVQVLKGGRNPRQLDGLVLYTSVEPCPMCLTRIINTGVKKTYWAADDPEGGMGRKIDDLPPFWRKGAEGRIYAGADCSPTLRDIAARLFKHGNMQTVK